MLITREEFAARRQRVTDYIGPDGIAFVSSGKEVNRTGDTTHYFRQNSDFYYLTGEREDIKGCQKYDISFEKFESSNVQKIEGNEEERLQELNEFWNGIDGAPEKFSNLDDAYFWMYEHLIEYAPFSTLISTCRGAAISLNELVQTIFPNQDKEKALQAVGVLLAIAPQAKNDKGTVLFPARMHMLFKGIKGIYACANPNCTHSHHDDALSLGDIFLSDGKLTCPHCQSVVYELYNDRRCGALFYKFLKLNNI